MQNRQQSVWEALDGEGESGIAMPLLTGRGKSVWLSSCSLAKENQATSLGCAIDTHSLSGALKYIGNTISLANDYFVLGSNGIDGPTELVRGRAFEAPATTGYRVAFVGGGAAVTGVAWAGSAAGTAGAGAVLGFWGDAGAPAALPAGCCAGCGGCGCGGRACCWSCCRRRWSCCCCCSWACWGAGWGRGARDLPWDGCDGVPAHDRHTPLPGGGGRFYILVPAAQKHKSTTHNPQNLTVGG